MAAITTFATADKNRPRLTPGPTLVSRSFTTPAAATADDSFTLETISPGETVTNASMSVSDTLGADSVLTLRIDTTAITAPTTATEAGLRPQTVPVAPSASARTLNILISVADISAAAVVTVTYFIVTPVA